MDLVTHIIGDAGEAAHHDALHALEHRGAVERVTLPRADLARRRLRATTDKGAEIAIALPRSATLFHNALLLLTEDRAVILRVEAETWLTLRPRDAAAALALGYHAGNLHWRVRFDGPLLKVAVETELDAYLARLDGFLLSGAASVVSDPEPPATAEARGASPAEAGS